MDMQLQKRGDDYKWNIFHLNLNMQIHFDELTKSIAFSTQY